jgi:predicted alpha/beta hydrolase family esterase
MHYLIKIFFISCIFISFEINAFNPGKESQFIGTTIIDAPKGKDSLTISDPDKAIILVYNQGWGADTSKSRYIRGTDKCFVDFYAENEKEYKMGMLGPWYSLSSELRYQIDDKKIYLYYFCKNRAQEGSDADTLRSMMVNNLVKLVDAFVDQGVPRQQIIPIGHSGGAAVVLEAVFKKPDKIHSVIATSWTVSGKKPWTGDDIQENKRFAARYKKNEDSLNALVYACNQDEFTSYEEQVFWKEVKGVELVELEGGHICWFNLFNDHQEVLRVLEFIQSGLD